MPRRWALSSEQLAVGLLFVAISALAAMAKVKSDTWWQLRGGADIWEKRAVSYVDTYSYTARGAYWPNHEWLTEVLFYAAHAVGGMPLLATFCALAIVVAYALSWRLTSGRFEVRFGLFVLALSSAVGAWSMRPQVVTMACFMVACTLLVKDRVWALPPLFLLWANLHGAVGLGLVSVGAVLAVEVVVTRRVPLKLLGAAVACFAATAATPMGVGLWQLLIAYGQRTKTQGISEWMPPGPPPEYFAFWVITALLIVAALRSWRHLSGEHRRLMAIAFATLPLALSAHRNVVMFLLIAVPAVSALLMAGRRQPSPPPPADYTRANGAIAMGAAILAGLLVALTWTNPPPRLNWSPITPEAIAAVSSCPRPFYNSHAVGGVLIGFTPQQPVFIDNRNDPYPVDLLDANLRLEQSGDYQELFARYQIRCAVVEPGTLTESALKTDPHWVVLHGDRRLTVFVRR
jgi:hypothetical protein